MERDRLFVSDDIQPFHQEILFFGEALGQTAAATMGSQSCTYFLLVFVFSQKRFRYFSAISGIFRQRRR